MSPQLTASLCFLLKDLKCKIIIKVTVPGTDASSNGAKFACEFRTSFFRSKAQFYRSYRTRLPCSPVIVNLAGRRPSVHSVSASCMHGKFLDNSEVVVLVVRILFNHEILRHKLRIPKNPVSVCVCFVVLLYKNLTQTLCSIQIIFIKRSCSIDLRRHT